MAVEQKSKNRSADLMAVNKRHVSATNARSFDIVAERGEGSYLFDVNGERYLDFTCGIAVNNVGHCHPSVVKAAKEQVDKLIHTAMVTTHQPMIDLSAKLAEITPGRLDSVF